MCVPEQVSMCVLQQGGAQQVQVAEGGQVVIQEESFVHQEERDKVHQPTTNTHTSQTHKLTPHIWKHTHRKRSGNIIKLGYYDFYIEHVGLQTN